MQTVVVPQKFEILASHATTQDTELEMILDREARAAGIDPAHINLLVPEVKTPPSNPFKDIRGVIAYVRKNNETDYTLCFKYSPGTSSRKMAVTTIAHEIAHIKYGDLEHLTNLEVSLGRILPGWAKQNMFTVNAIRYAARTYLGFRKWLLQEPRAELYGLARSMNEENLRL